MTKKQIRKQGNKAAGVEDVDNNVDRIRDILFGNQMRDYDSRLDAMENRLVQTIEHTARDLERRIERLDKYARREVAKLTEQVKAERKDRVAEGKKNSRELADLAGQVETWVNELDEQLEKESGDLHTSLHDQAEDLAAQIRKTRSQLLAALQEETAELRDTQLAREDMAELLTEVALRLNKDFKLPKG